MAIPKFGWFTVVILAASIALASFLSAPVSAGHPIQLEDRTAAAGIDMPHIGGGTFMTGQVIADFTNNGLPDLFLTRASHNSPNQNRLYLNQGDGSFQIAPFSVDVELPGWRSSGALALDYDNDGWTDLLVLSWGRYTLFRNLQGEGFQDVTEQSGLTYPGRGTSAAAADFTGNGYLDLYITNFNYSGQSFPGCDGQGGCDATDRLFRNNGDGTFTDVTEDCLDLAVLDREGFAPVWTDYNNNGRPDLYVVNDRHRGNVLFRNDGPGCDGWCFTDISAESGAEVVALGMGIAVGDYNNDGWQDLFVTDAFTQHLLRNLGAEGVDGFELASEEAGVDAPVFAWGPLLLDLDNSGWLDLYINTEAAKDPTPDFRHLCTRIYSNNGDGTFTEVSEQIGDRLCGPNFGIAAGDLFGDGRLDLVIGRYNRQYRILKNTSKAGNYLRVRPIGGHGINRDAVGARAWLTDSQGQVQMREVINGIGLGGGSELTLHFGLGDRQPAALLIRWPNDTYTTVPVPSANQTVEVQFPGIIFSDRFETRPQGPR